MNTEDYSNVNRFREIKRACCIPHCKSKHFDSKKLSNTGFYTFPDETTDFITYRCWLRDIRKCKSEVGESLRDTKNAFICELHFRKEDFVMDVVSGRKLLKKGSVPFFPCDKGRSANVVLDPAISTANRKDLVEEQKRLREYKLSMLKEKIEFQKDPSRLKLLQQKEQQEDKLRRLLAQQEEHKKQIVKDKQKPVQLITQLGKERVDEVERIRELEKQEERITDHYKQDFPVKPSKTNKQANSSQWRKKKENLQIMLEQQKVRLAEIQRQESDIEIRKRKHHPEDDILEKEYSIATVASPITSVISCGKCFKLEAELNEITQQFEELKKENEILRIQLQKRL